MVSATSSNTAYLQKFQFSNLQNWSVRYLLENTFSYNQQFELVPIGDFLIRNKEIIEVQDGVQYRRVTIKINNNGVFLRDMEKGENIGTKRQYIVRKGQFIMSKIDARNGAFGLIPDELDGAIVTNDFPSFHVDNTRINTQFLVLITTTKEFIRFAQSCSSGTTNRQRINVDLFLQQRIPLPSLEEQERIVAEYYKKIHLAERQEEEANKTVDKILNLLCDSIGVIINQSKTYYGLRILKYSDLDRWDGQEVQSFQGKYPTKKIGDLAINISTGTTPSTSKKDYYQNGSINFYTPADLTDIMYLTNSERKVSDTALKDKKIRVFQKDTLLFVGIGSTVGKVGIVKNDLATSNQQITGIVFDDSSINIDFAYFYFNFFKDITTKEKTKATIPIVNQEKIKNIPIPLPPLGIQNDIVNKVFEIYNRKTKLLEESSANKTQAIKNFENEIFQID